MKKIKVVVGIQWGDEGKGRMIDYFAKSADFVARYQGGNNAGHTVVNDFGTFKLHLIPSGIFNPNAINILGPGMIIDIEALCNEIDSLKEAGIKTDNIRISDRATICFPFHRLLDELEEKRLGKDAFGSTKRGISPAYSDRYMKKSIQLGELLHPEKLSERIKAIIEWKNLEIKAAYNHEEIDSKEVTDWALKYGQKLKDLICDTGEILNEAAKEEKEILFEAQLGALRDVYFGIYPFTSASNVLSSFAQIGAGLFYKSEMEVIGVMKAFSTCVGAGPFVTEITGKVSDELRETAFEYGAATGRPRRIGHFDAVAAAYGAYVQGTDFIALTKLDCLSGQEKLLICTEYKTKEGRTKTFPINAVLDEAEPVYIEMPGWTEDITGCRDFNNLPQAAKDYVLKIEELIGFPLKYISVGPERESLITINLEKKALVK